jgi:hypothetical protein
MKGGTTIFNAQPGVFFYFVKVTAPGSSFTVEIPQMVEPGETTPLFGIQSTSAFSVVNGTTCTAFAGIKVEGSAANDIIKFSGATTGTSYVVAVKYQPKSIVGKPEPKPNVNPVYTFAAILNKLLVPASAQKLVLIKTG